MLLKCPQLRIKLQELKSLFSNYCLELEQAKTTKEFDSIWNTQAKLQQAIIELRLEVDPDKYYQEYTTEIERKSKANIPLTKAEIIFLYDVDHIFGYERDPRIQEILDNREDTKSDLSLITGYPKEQISTTEEEALAGNIKYHYGYLDLSRLRLAKGLTLPNHISGNLSLYSLRSTEGLTLPSHIGGYLHLSSLRSAEGLTLPSHIGGNLDLSDLRSAEGLILPSHIGGYLSLFSLTSAEKNKLRKQYPNLEIF